MMPDALKLFESHVMIPRHDRPYGVQCVFIRGGNLTAAPTRDRTTGLCELIGDAVQDPIIS